MAIDSNCNIAKLNNVFLESCVSFIELEIRHVPSKYNIKDLSISHTALIIICIRRVYIYNSFHEISMAIIECYCISPMMPWIEFEIRNCFWFILKYPRFYIIPKKKAAMSLLIILRSERPVSV